MTIARLGTIFSFNIETPIAGALGPVGALWVAAGFCGASVITNVIYIAMDWCAEPLLKLREEGAGD